VSQVFKADITLHQVGMPPNKACEAFPKAERHLHLADHTKGHEHYNSVRPLGSRDANAAAGTQQGGDLKKRKADEQQSMPTKRGKLDAEGDIEKENVKKAVLSLSSPRSSTMSGQHREKAVLSLSSA